MSRVALVYPYFRTRAPTELLFAPLGVAVLAMHLRGLGIDARVFDCTFSTFDQLRQALLEYQPDVVGVHSMITLSRNTFRIARLVRTDLPGCLLVAGGPLPTLYPERFNAQFDVVFRGEADLSFPLFCRDFFHPFENIIEVTLRIDASREGKSNQLKRGRLEFSIHACSKHY